VAVGAWAFVFPPGEADCRAGLAEEGHVVTRVWGFRAGVCFPGEAQAWAADCYLGMEVWEHSDAQASRKAFRHPLQRRRLSLGAGEFPWLPPLRKNSMDDMDPSFECSAFCSLLSGVSLVGTAA
jgi:hypothetical protein